MRWRHGFSKSAESFEGNYRNLIDAAGRYGVSGIIIWGFLRDRHGGIDSAKRICDYAHERGVMIIPGFGVDAYGGAYYEGESDYSLDKYLLANPEAMALGAEGKPLTHRWPPTDPNETHVCCPSHEPVMDYYRESIEWLINTFDLRGVQIEQGDVGLCNCAKCTETRGQLVCGEMADFSAGARRMKPLIDHALSIKPDLLIVVETYAGLLAEQIQRVSKDIELYPEQVVLSWQAYNAPDEMFIDENSRSPSPHGCIAVRTNSDCYEGEHDDRENIIKALSLAKNAGLDYTYIYGEYPDTWPITKSVYEAWAKSAE